MSSITEAVSKYRQLIIVLIGVSAFFVLVYGLRHALLPFIVGFIVIYFMNGTVRWVEQRFPHSGKWGSWFEGKQRVLSILVVNTVIVLAVGLVGFYLFSTLVQALSVLFQDASGHWANAVASLANSTSQYIPDAFRGQLDEFARNSGTYIDETIRSSSQKIVAQIPAALGTLFGLAVTPLFVFYMLKDREKLSRSFYSAMPQWAAQHVRNIFLIIENVLGRYIRAQLTLGAVVGTFSFIGLLIVRAPLAPVLALVSGITEMIPTVGPIIGLVVGVAVTLALAPEKTLWVALVFLVVQLLENNILVPRIQSGYLGLHPVVTIVLLVLGAGLAGIWGMILAVPLTATALQIGRYVRQVAREQERESVKVEVRS